MVVLHVNNNTWVCKGTVVLNVDNNTWICKGVVVLHVNNNTWICKGTVVLHVNNTLNITLKKTKKTVIDGHIGGQLGLSLHLGNRHPGSRVICGLKR